MKEFMFFIRKRTSSQDTLPPERHTMFLKSCERYIAQLKSEERLLSAQPIEWSGSVISHADGKWGDSPFGEGGEVIGGYYHIRANDLTEAISIARQNPEFEFNPQTRIEVRPVKMKEEKTGFEYPKG